MNYSIIKNTKLQDTFDFQVWSSWSTVYTKSKYLKLQKLKACTVNPWQERCAVNDRCLAPLSVVTSTTVWKAVFANKAFLQAFIHPHCFIDWIQLGRTVEACRPSTQDAGEGSRVWSHTGLQSKTLSPEGYKTNNQKIPQMLILRR